jgi:Outer membrane protein beta-barrel domain
MKNILIWFFYFATITVAHSQDVAPQKWRFGMQVGGGVSSIAQPKDPYALQFSYKSSYQIQALAHRHIYRRLSTQMEVGITLKGFEATDLAGGGQQAVSFANTYVQIGFMPELQLNKRWSLNLGAEGAFLVSESPKFIDNGQPFEIAAATQLKCQVNDKIGFGARISRSLTPYQYYYVTDSQGETIDKVNYYNQYGLLFAQVRL